MQKVKSIIAPSILSCDFSNLYEDCQKLIQAGSDWLHFDIMHIYKDGHFVPNITIGPQVVEDLNRRINPTGQDRVFLDCHCMVSEPMRWVEALHKAGADQITIHLESNVESFDEISRSIRQRGMLVGLAIKPATLVDDRVLDLLDRNMFDMVLVMTVEPGFGGQKFMEHMIPKVEFLRKRYQYLNIQVDGGISSENVGIVGKAGANVIVSGTGIVKQINQAETIKFFRDRIDNALYN